MFFMSMKQKRTLAEIQNILSPGDEYLSAVTIPVCKSIILDDLGMNEQFLLMNISDRRKLIDWFTAAKKALQIVSNINEQTEVKNNANIDPTQK